MDDRREVARWSFYAFANHGWVTTVGTVLIGPWLLALAKKDAGSSHATLFAIGPYHLSAAAFPSFLFACAALTQLAVLPALGATADALAAKKRILALTCGLGATIAALLGTSGGSAWLYAGLLYLVGTVVFGASDTVYNAFLPQLVSPERRDATSSRGFATGYLGAGTLLTLNLALLHFRGALGLAEGTAVRICFVSAGLWWAGFGFVAIAGLRERGASTTRERRGAAELWATLRELRGMPNAFRYLLAYLFFSDAVSAVISLSSTYITHELYDDNATRASTFLFSLILLIQFVAVAGSILVARIARRAGTKNTILGTLAVWSLVILYAYLQLRTTGQAVAMGVVLGLVLGGTQALARSLFSQLIPRGREATYFGLYEVCDRGTSWIAPLLFTIVVNATGSFRQAILSLLVLFVAGAVLLASSDIDRARAEAATAGG